VGGIADVVLENKTASLSAIDDEEGFAANLLMMVNDPVMRKNFSEAGMGHVMNKFGYKRLVADMSNLYYDLLSRKNKQ
jgi:glycosyltransferase involved in cell wall biosynthesis